MLPLISVAIGGALGSVLRWRMSAWLNNPHAWLPWGTLSVNWIGGFFIGVLIAFFEKNTHLSPEWKLFLITGILGGLTTFSTFTAEAVSLLEREAYVALASQILLHVVGSILLCIAGIALVKSLLQ